MKGYISYNPVTLSEFGDDLILNNEEIIFIFDVDFFLTYKEYNLQLINAYKKSQRNYEKSNINANEYFNVLEVNELYEIYKKRNLKKVLESIPVRKICISNYKENVVKKILDHLGIEMCFEYAVCIDKTETGTTCMPSNYSYEFIEQLFGLIRKNQIYFFSSNDKFIKAAANYKWRTFKKENGDDIVNFLAYLKQELFPWVYSYN